MAEKALVLSADHWEMADEKTGELRRGVSVWYVNDYRAEDGKSLGFKPTKISADVSLLEQLRAAKLPALFSIDFASRPGAQGKAALTLVGMTKLADIDIFAAAAGKTKAA